MMCHIRWYLVQRGLYFRQTSPLDNMVSQNIDVVISVLSTPDPLEWFPEDQICVNGIFHKNWIVGNHLSDNKIVSYHDFPITGSVAIEEAMEQVKDRFHCFLQKKRQSSANLIKAIETADDILLVRVNRKRERLAATIRLRDTIASMRNDKPFDLWVFQDADFMKKNWRVPNLQTFHDELWIFDGNTKEWHSNNKPFWDKLFSTVCLKNPRLLIL